MARTRLLKPGFFTNDVLLEIEPLGRLLFAGLWCHADKLGRLEDRPRRIKLQILPCDNCDVNQLLEALTERGFIHRYIISEVPYIQIVNFNKHQTPHHKEAASTIPEEGEHVPRQVLAPTKASDSPSVYGLPSPVYLNPSATTKTPGGSKTIPFDAKGVQLPEWLPEDSWHDFVEMRSAIKKAVSRLSVTRLISSLEKLRSDGHDPVEVIDQSISNNWAGFFPIKKQKGNTDATKAYADRYHRELAILDGSRGKGI